MRPLSIPNVRIRVAGEDDALRLQRLAELDSAAVPVGRLLVAEVGGELWAARQIDGSHTIADPFHPTADLLALLTLRCRQLHGGSRHGRLRAAGRPRLIEARQR
ncbi:MAG TPA: hypothetical protein VID68_11885 [Solirubrobacteraceae bacterium]|jgi:hypothetical protein